MEEKETEVQDVDSKESDELYEELKKTLDAKEEEPREEPPKEEKEAEEPEPKAEEAVEEAKAPETPEPPAEPSASPSFKNVQEFLEAVEDVPSRNLLEKFYQVIKNETSETLAPIEQKNNEAKFESEFSKYEKIEGLGDYKNDLRKTFLRNPKQNLKGLIGEVVTDLQLNKVKPVEKTPSTPNRDKVDTSNLTKEQLYDMLETLRE